MSDLFKIAARQKFRFETPQGAMLAEDLWDLPLTATNANRANLDDVARNLHRKLNNGDNVSFVGGQTKSDPTIQMKFDLVREVIDDRLAAMKKIDDEREAAERKQKIMKLIADKKDENLKNLSVEELEKLLA